MAGNLEDARAEILAPLTDPVKYDLGSGPTPEEGFKGIDYYADAPDVLKADLFTYPWPLADESVDYFHASHFVEHVPDWNAHFTEIYRCLKTGGHYELRAPFYLNNRWFQDPDHKQPILHERFIYLSRKWREDQEQDHRGDLAKVNFVVVNFFELLNDDFREQGYSPDAIAYHKRHSWNVIDDLAVIVKKLPMDE